MSRGRHPYNVKLVKQFMLANKGKAYNRVEVARNCNISKGAATNILREMYKKGELEKHLVKERDGSTKVYYNWSRCEHLAADRCVVREKPCDREFNCCLNCRKQKDCNDACSISILANKEKEEKEKGDEPE